MPPIRRTTLGLALLALCFAGCDPSDTKGPDKPAISAEPAKEASVVGVDTSTLTPRERREWMAQVSELLAPCADVPVSIAQCVNEARPCKTCKPAAEFLLRQVQGGRAKKEREDAYRSRFDPTKVKPIVLDGSPSKGDPDAVVTIAEWADFQCPFCKLVYPMLDDLVERFDGQLRVVYKFYPLKAHPQGEIAARAAVAAGNQGKFWEMHHMMFDNQERLEQTDLERYAKRIELDVFQFRKDMVSKETTDRIEADKKQADDLGLEGTPFLFVNGREADLSTFVNPYDDLEEWIRLDIELAGKTPKPKPPKPAPGASASAAPSAAPSTAPSTAPAPPKP